MSDMLWRLTAIALGGALGAVGRYGAGILCIRLWGERFGYGTLLVNVLGCFVLGLLMHESWIAAERLSPHAHAGLTVGLLGGLTTFSTFGYQTVRHLELGEPGLAIANVGANLVAGLCAAMAGLALGRAWQG